MLIIAETNNNVGKWLHKVGVKKMILGLSSIINGK